MLGLPADTRRTRKRTRCARNCQQSGHSKELAWFRRRASAFAALAGAEGFDHDRALDSHRVIIVGPASTVSAGRKPCTT